MSESLSNGIEENQAQKKIAFHKGPDKQDHGQAGHNAIALNPSSITSPIPLIAYTGTLYIGLTGGYLVLLDQQHFSLNLMIYALPVLFPFILLISVVYLISCHHSKLYSPSDFSSADHFLKTLTKRSQDVVSMNFIDQMNLTDATKFNSSEIRKRKYRSAFARASSNLTAFETVVSSLSPSHLEILHSWYNAFERHDLALVCMDLAIARGAMSSKNFAYRSASLRKLGRLIEARASAQLSIALNPSGDHSDAHYNLAKTEIMVGNYKLSLYHLDKARLTGKVNEDKIKLLENEINRHLEGAKINETTETPIQ